MAREPEPRRPLTTAGRASQHRNEEAQTAIDASAAREAAAIEEASRNRRIPKILNPFKFYQGFPWDDEIERQGPSQASAEAE
jgi:hypothetical protein